MMNLKEMTMKMFATENSTGALIARLTLGLVIFPHGAQKLLGWFGGHGFAGTMGFFTEQMGIPYVFALLAVLAEFFGALALVVGAATRLSALMVGGTIGVAALMVHLPHGFFMNWYGAQEGEGFEYHLLVVGLALALVAWGGGRWSVDRLIAKKQDGVE